MATKKPSQPSRPVEKLSLSVHTLPKLTSKKQEILRLYTKQNLSTKKIARLCKCSIRAIQIHLKQLREMGVLHATTPNETSEGFSGSSSEGERTLTSRGDIRLHGLQFHVDIIKRGSNYESILEKSNVQFYDNWTVRLYKNGVEVHDKRSFFGSDPHEATAQAFDALHRLLSRLEHDFGIVLVRSRYQNIRVVAAHYAEVGNELAKQAHVNDQLIKVKTREDGKIWFIIDNSFNLHEAETIHPETSKQDMAEVVQPFFNDLREHNPLRNSELESAFLRTQEQLRMMAISQNTIIDYIKQQVKPPQYPRDKNFNYSECGYFG